MVAYVVYTHPRDDPSPPTPKGRWTVRSYRPERPERVVVSGGHFRDGALAYVRALRSVGCVAGEPVLER